jgi:hypothetical protein
VLQLHSLESREVPATFYVDPTLAGSPDGSTQTFNAGKSNQVGGLVFGTSSATPGATLFSSLSEAFAAAGANFEADTVFLADGAIGVDDPSGTLTVVNDRITLVGSGRTRTTLRPTADTAGATFGSIEFNSGSNLTASALTFNGAGHKVGSAFYFDSSSASFNDVTIENTRFDTSTGTGIVATYFSTLSVTNTLVANYERIGVFVSDSTATISNSRVIGLGAGATGTLNYGLQVINQSNVTVTGTVFGQNRVSQPRAGGGFERSAAILLYSDPTAPTATITGNTFTDNYHAVQVGDNPGVDTSTAVLRNNWFATSNVVGVQAENKTTVDARQNFWGARNGPLQATTNPNGKGTTVSAGVDFGNFLTVAPGTGSELKPGYAIGSGGGAGSSAFLVNGQGGLTTTIPAFGGAFQGEVRVAAGDMTGDGTLDVIVSAGPGGGPHVQAFDGVTGAQLKSFFAFQPQFTGGVFVGASDVNGDGRADIVVGAGPGGAPHVRVFDAVTGAEIRSFFAYQSQFTSGVLVAGGDVNGDGVGDIVTGAGRGGAPHVKVFSGTTGVELQSFFAYPSQFTGGVFVAAGDVNGDGRADVITGAASSGAPHVRVWTSNVDGSRGPLVANFFLDNNASFTGGVRVAAHDLDDDGRDDVLLGYGNGGDSKVRVLMGTDIGNPAAVRFSIPGSVFTTTTGIFVG